MTHISLNERHTIFNKPIHTEGCAASDAVLMLLDSDSDTLVLTEKQN